MYTYRFTKQVEKFLEKQDKNFLKLFLEKLGVLMRSPFDNNLDIKSLKWLENNYRLRIWKYRFLYIIEDNTLCIYFYRAGSRGDVYK